MDYEGYVSAGGRQLEESAIRRPQLDREIRLLTLELENQGMRLLFGSVTSDVVWLTADVHYSAAIHYAPERATFEGFDPFWEFVSGPLHAGTWAPAPLDNTFGPAVAFQKGCSAEQGENLAPCFGLQFFGRVDLGNIWFFHAPVPADTTKDNFDFTASLHRAVGARRIAARRCLLACCLTQRVHGCSMVRRRVASARSRGALLAGSPVTWMQGRTEQRYRSPSISTAR